MNRWTYWCLLQPLPSERVASGKDSEVLSGPCDLSQGHLASGSLSRTRAVPTGVARMYPLRGSGCPV